MRKGLGRDLLRQFRRFQGREMILRLLYIFGRQVPCEVGVKEALVVEDEILPV